MRQKSAGARQSVANQRTLESGSKLPTPQKKRPGVTGALKVNSDGP